MRRRNFLAITGSSVAALPLAGFSVTAAGMFAADVIQPSGFRLARLDEAAGEFIALRACAATACSTSRVSLELDALHTASERPALATLQVQALFDGDDGSQYPYTAWNFRADSPYGSSRNASFTASRESMRGFGLRYRLQDAVDDQTTRCALTRLDSPLLQPGSYVLTGPRRDGRSANLRAYRFAADAAAPLQPRYGQSRDFDYLAFRIREVA